jgi:ketosteroid isomerase-like protein
MSPAEAIRAVCDAWSRLDNDAIAAAFAEDGLFEDPLHERQLAGRDDIRDTNAVAVAGLRECEVTLRHVLEDGRLGFAEGRFEAVDVDGNRMDFPFAMVVEMSGDGIGRLSEYFDTRPLVP